MSADTIYAVLLALDGETLLLPNAAVVEVVSAERVQPEPGAPDWQVGVLDWNARRVPVIRFERLNGAPTATTVRRERIVIINSLGVHTPSGILAFVAQGYPHLITLNRNAVKSAPLRETDRSDLVLSRVRIASQEALIPDLETIEADLARAATFGVTPTASA